jgi:hypothetical protein
MRSWRALTRSRAYTDPDADDPRLRGRRYGVPFREVWEAAVETAGALPRWRVLSADPRKGEISVEAGRLLRRGVDDVWIRVSLDEEGQTRVDLACATRSGRPDLGAGVRRIARFLHALERRLAEGGGANRQP